MAYTQWHRQGMIYMPKKKVIKNIQTSGGGETGIVLNPINHNAQLLNFFRLYLTTYPIAPITSSAFPGPLNGINLSQPFGVPNFFVIMDRNYSANVTTGDILTKVNYANWTTSDAEFGAGSYVELPYMFIIDDKPNGLARRISFTSSTNPPRLMSSLKSITDTTVSQTVRYILKYINKTSTYTDAFTKIEDYTLQNIKVSGEALNVFYLFTNYNFTNDELIATFNDYGAYHASISTVINLVI